MNNFKQYEYSLAYKKKRSEIYWTSQSYEIYSIIYWMDDNQVIYFLIIYSNFY